MRLRIPASWPPGDYLFKLVASNAGQSYVPLTVRDDDSHAALVIQNSVATWQAYNLWGGYSLYEGATPPYYETRSRAVSFDRPYAGGRGASQFFWKEQAVVSLAEQQGLDITYWTDVDLHEHPERLSNHQGLITLGHDEYWSSKMRRRSLRRLGRRTPTLMVKLPRTVGSTSPRVRLMSCSRHAQALSDSLAGFRRSVRRERNSRSRSSPTMVCASR